LIPFPAIADGYEFSPIAATPSGYTKSRSTGIEFYNYKNGDGPEAKMGDRVVFNYKGRLAGRQGWIYADTFTDGTEPVRVTLGTTDCIEGLVTGIVGDGDDMPPMKYAYLPLLLFLLILPDSLILPSP
jgi:hypothetical protein